MNLFEEWDEIIAEVHEFHKYVDGKYDELMDRRDKCTSKKLTTLCDHLGIASPSNLSPIVIGGYKKGRIVKNIPKNGRYCEFFYDENSLPVCMYRYTGIGHLSDVVFWINYNGNVWTTSLDKFEEIDTQNNFKITTENEKLKGFYHFQYQDQVAAEIYDYSEYDNGIIWCTYYHYVPELWKSSRDIPAGFPNSPMSQWKYKIYINDSGKYLKYDLYKNIKGNFVLKGQYDNI